MKEAEILLFLPDGAENMDLLLLLELLVPRPSNSESITLAFLDLQVANSRFRDFLAFVIA